jgi:glutaconate CoA-transferase subunit A
VRTERIISEDAATNWIEDGMTVAIGAPAPMTMVRQIVRRGVRDLTVIDSGLSLDLLIAAGCVRKTISYYAGGHLGVPVLPNFRRAAQSGELAVWECEEGILCAGLQAAAQLLPFMPWRGGIGTSIPEVNPDLKLFTDPIAGETLIAVPPIKPDVCLLHAAGADAYGNVRHFGGPGWLDLFLYRAADRVVVEVEQVIPNEEIRANPWATTIAGADAIVRAPFGAHPFYSRGFYLQDVGFVGEYFEIAQNAERDPVPMQRWIDRYCREPANHAAYLERVGIARLLALNEF